MPDLGDQSGLGPASAFLNESGCWSRCDMHSSPVCCCLQIGRDLIMTRVATKTWSQLQKMLLGIAELKLVSVKV